jgi:cytochrome c556
MAASVADDNMANIIKYRQGLMKADADHARDIGMILKNEVPFNARHIEEHAVAINAMSKLIIQCFPKGSGPASGNKTRAKEDIWTHWEKFMADAVALERESAKLVDLTRTGNMNQIEAQMAIVGQNSCGDCHEDFRTGD